MNLLFNNPQRELQNKIIEVQSIILQKGICDDNIGPCSRGINNRMWRYLGFPYCEKGEEKSNCLFGGELEKMIRIRLWDKIPFYKAIIWEYDPDMQIFRLLEIVGKPWKLKNREERISERNFIYSHYKGRVGIITKKESKLLIQFLEKGIDAETLYCGFECSKYVDPNAKHAFGPQTGIGLRLDYISGFRKKEGAIALMLLFYKKENFYFEDSGKQKKMLNFPDTYEKENESIKELTELAKTISYFVTPVIISEIFRRKIYGRPFSLCTKDFQ